MAPPNRTHRFLSEATLITLASAGKNRTEESLTGIIPGGNQGILWGPGLKHDSSTCKEGKLPALWIPLCLYWDFPSLAIVPVVEPQSTPP